MFIDHGTLAELRELVGLTPRHIAEAARALLTAPDPSVLASV